MAASRRVAHQGFSRTIVPGGNYSVRPGGTSPDLDDRFNSDRRRDVPDRLDYLRAARAEESEMAVGPGC